MDNNRKKGGPTSPGRSGEYEMLDRNMSNPYTSPSAPPMAPQPQYAVAAQQSVSRSDLDVLETTAAPAAAPYGYNAYPGYQDQGELAAHYQGQGDPAAHYQAHPTGHYPVDPDAHYPVGHTAPYHADAGAGYFQHDGQYVPQPQQQQQQQQQGGYHSDYSGSSYMDPALPQAAKPLPMPHTLTLHEAHSFQSTPVMTDDGGSTSKEGAAPGPSVRFDPRIMPEVDPAVANLYNKNEMPPPDARRFKQFQSQRRRKIKKVGLTSGKLVLDSLVPGPVLERGKFRDQKEFTHVRYTPVTVDANHFMKEGYTLRPAELGRQTELFIVLTMYNEDEVLFNRTFLAVMKNIAHLCSRTNSRTWGENAWEKVVVCIVADGMAKVNPRVLAVLGALGVYQEGIMQKSVDEVDVHAHVFEYTVQSALDTNMNFVGHQQTMPPVQVLFCLKVNNAKKINSHRWFFNAFAKVLQPNICVLIDVGTKPTGTSIYHLWKSFDHDERVAGACGEIAADLGKGCNLVFKNPLVAAQNFEYKISNILDKPLESVFGYISVLPGAFSAYRYSALQNTSENEGPLYEYFKGELMHTDGSDSSIFQANMYLAEDRILCFELVAKRRQNYILRYVRAAKAETDVPDNLAELISQRRRWLNGSFFATFYALVHWYRMVRTTHSLYRRLMLTIELIYQTISMIFSWFSIANLYLAYFFLEQNLKTIYDSQKLEGKAKISLNADPFHGGGYIVMEVFRELYILALVMQFVLSLGNRPQGAKAIYRFSVLIFSIIMVIIVYVAMYGVVYTAVHTNYDGGVDSLLKQEKFRDIVISMAATYGLYIIASLLYFEPWHMITSFIQYMLWLPSSINILMVYAFCNTHDVSWGTKGDTAMVTTLSQAKTGTKDGQAYAQVSVAADAEAANKDYEDFITELKSPKEPEVTTRDVATKREDANKSFRTMLVLSWMSSNMVLAMVISSTWFTDIVTKTDGTGSQNIYLSIIFWSVAGLAAFRFLGSLWYRIRFLFHD